jgi:hypothetical protein
METGRFHPGSLQLETVAARPDALGRLASVFVEMAHQVYDREVALQRNIRTLKGGALLLLQGLLWGLVVPLPFSSIVTIRCRWGLLSGQTSSPVFYAAVGQSPRQRAFASTGRSFSSFSPGRPFSD